MSSTSPAGASSLHCLHFKAPFSFPSLAALALSLLSGPLPPPSEFLLILVAFFGLRFGIFGGVSCEILVTEASASVSDFLHKMNHIQVSSSKKLLFFYVNLAKMDYQESFFKEQMEKIHKATEEKDMKFERLLQAERAMAKQSDMGSGTNEDQKQRKEEIESFICSQEKGIEEFEAKREKLIRTHEQKKVEFKRSPLKSVLKLKRLSDLQKKCQKREDALIAAKKLSSQTHSILAKLNRCFLQAQDYSEMLKRSEQELKFEWAWQHPTESLAIRKAASNFKSLSGIAIKIKIAYIMLNLPSWENLNLTVNFFSTKYMKHLGGYPKLPKQMKVNVCHG